MPRFPRVEQTNKVEASRAFETIEFVTLDFVVEVVGM